MSQMGEGRFVEREIGNLDNDQVETDRGPGWATSAETALDLCRDRPAEDIPDEIRHEMIRRLADRIDWGRIDWGRIDWGRIDWGRIDWGRIDKIAVARRGVKSSRRLRTILDRPRA